MASPPRIGPHALLLTSLPANMTYEALVSVASSFDGGRNTVHLAPPTTAIIDFEFASVSREAKKAWARCGPGLANVSSDPYGSRYRAAVEENCSPVTNDSGDARAPHAQVYVSNRHGRDAYPAQSSRYVAPPPSVPRRPRAAPGDPAQRFPRPISRYSVAPPHGAPHAVPFHHPWPLMPQGSFERLGESAEEVRKREERRKQKERAQKEAGEAEIKRRHSVRRLPEPRHSSSRFGSTYDGYSRLGGDRHLEGGHYPEHPLEEQRGHGSSVRQGRYSHGGTEPWRSGSSIGKGGADHESHHRSDSYPPRDGDYRSRRRSVGSHRDVQVSRADSAELPDHYKSADDRGRWPVPSDTRNGSGGSFNENWRQETSVAACPSHVNAPARRRGQNASYCSEGDAPRTAANVEPGRREEHVAQGWPSIRAPGAVPGHAAPLPLHNDAASAVQASRKAALVTKSAPVGDGKLAATALPAEKPCAAAGAVGFEAPSGRRDDMGVLPGEHASPVLVSAGKALVECKGGSGIEPGGEARTVLPGVPKSSDNAAKALSKPVGCAVLGGGQALDKPERRIEDLFFQVDVASDSVPVELVSKPEISAGERQPTGSAPVHVPVRSSECRSRAEGNVAKTLGSAGIFPPTQGGLNVNHLGNVGGAECEKGERNLSPKEEPSVGAHAVETSKPRCSSSVPTSVLNPSVRSVRACTQRESSVRLWVTPGEASNSTAHAARRGNFGLAVFPMNRKQPPLEQKEVEQFFAGYVSNSELRPRRDSGFVLCFWKEKMRADVFEKIRVRFNAAGGGDVVDGRLTQFKTGDKVCFKLEYVMPLPAAPKVQPSPPDCLLPVRPPLYVGSQTLHEDVKTFLGRATVGIVKAFHTKASRRNTTGCVLAVQKFLSKPRKQTVTLRNTDSPALVKPGSHAPVEPVIGGGDFGRIPRIPRKAGSSIAKLPKKSEISTVPVNGAREGSIPRFRSSGPPDREKVPATGKSIIDSADDSDTIVINRPAAVSRRGGLDECVASSVEHGSEGEASLADIPERSLKRKLRSKSSGTKKRRRTRDEKIDEDEDGDVVMEAGREDKMNGHALSPSTSADDGRQYSTGEPSFDDEFPHISDNVRVPSKETVRRGTHEMAVSSADMKSDADGGTEDSGRVCAVRCSVLDWKEHRKTKKAKAAVAVGELRELVSDDRVKSRVAKGESNVKSARSSRSEGRKLRQGLHEANLGANSMAMSVLAQRQKRLTFGKSTIHGMGLFTLEDVPEGDFLIEYVGEIIRRPLSDVREARYEQKGMGDSYLFRLTTDLVIDATRKGSIARFINHSCEPNVQAKTIQFNGEPKIAFYTKHALKRGEEITYDYQFAYEDEDKKVACLCSAPSCRQTLN